MRNQRKFEVYSLVVSVIIVMSILGYRYLHDSAQVKTDKYSIIVVNHTQTPIRSVAYDTSGLTEVAQNADNSLIKEDEKLEFYFVTEPTGPFKISVTGEDLKIIATLKLEAHFDDNRQMQLELVQEAGSYSLKTVR